MRRVVVAFVTVELLRPEARPTGLADGPTNRRDGVDQRFELFESWTLAAVSVAASEMPCRSTIRWYFEPRLPRSVFEDWLRQAVPQRA
jgi:hypothetical protein